MSRAVALIVLIGILIGAAVYNVRARQEPVVPNRSSSTLPSEPVAVTTQKVTLGSILETLSAVGVVRSDRQAAVSARAPGRIVEISVREGARVTAGQRVVTLDLGDSGAQVSGAQAGVEAAQAQLRKAIDGKRARQVELDSQVSQAQTGLLNARVKLDQAELGAKLQESSTRSDAERARAAVLQAEAGLRQAETALDQAEKTLKRVEFLYSRGGAPRVEAEGARAQAEVARAQRDGAIAALRQAQAAEKPTSETAPLRERVSRQDVEAARLGVSQAEEGVKTARQARTEALRIADRDIEAARAAVKQAEASRQGVNTQLGSATLTSPIGGVVTELSAHAGEMAQPGQPLMTVVSTDNVYVEASVPSRYAPLLTRGTPARVTMESGVSPLAAEVQEVLPVGLGDGRTVPVRIRLRSQAARLSPGLSVTVTITLSSGRPQPQAPAEAIHLDGDRSFVFVVVNGKAERRDVRTGPSDGSRVTVLSGLDSGDAVITSGSSTLVNGARVTATPAVDR